MVDDEDESSNKCCNFKLPEDCSKHHVDWRERERESIEGRGRLERRKSGKSAENKRFSECLNSFEQRLLDWSFRMEKKGRVGKNM